MSLSFLRLSVLSLVTILFCCLLPSVHTPAQGLRAAVVKTDITPESSQWLVGYGPRKSTGIHDRIYHRVLVLDDGSTTFCLISSDICLVSPAEYDRVAARVQQELGIEPQNLWWTVTHTHSAPEVGPPGLPEVFMSERYEHEWDREYTGLVEDRLVSSIETALASLVPAKLGIGWGHSNANINRRAIGPDGRASLGLNPDGPVDRRIGLIRVDHRDSDQPLALVANYAIHGTVLGQPHTEISGDAPGIISAYVEEKIGAPMLFINGAAGNIAPIYSTYPNPRAGHLSQFQVLLGDKILEAYQQVLGTSSDITLSSGGLTVLTPRKEGLGWPEDLHAYAAQAPDGRPLIRLPIRFLRVGGQLAIWNAPLELFCEISNEIRDKSPFDYTYYFGYANGWLGYLPTAAAYAQGGYETDVVSAFTPRAGEDLIQAVLSYLHGPMRSARIHSPDNP